MALDDDTPADIPTHPTAPLRGEDDVPEIELEELHIDDAAGDSSVNVGARRRRRQAFVVIGAAVLSAAAGIGIGSQLKSPAERAADRKAPEASSITVPVERRALSSSLTLAGQVEFEEPTPIRLAGPVGASAGSTQVVTRAPQLDQVVQEGNVIAEISGRPVFAFQGALPVFRTLEPGVTGPDVAQLETALQRLGYFANASRSGLRRHHRSGDRRHVHRRRVPERRTHGGSAQGACEVRSTRRSRPSNASPRPRTTSPRAARRSAPPTACRPNRTSPGRPRRSPSPRPPPRRANDEAVVAVTTATGLRDAARRRATPPTRSTPTPLRPARSTPSPVSSSPRRSVPSCRRCSPRRRPRCSPPSRRSAEPSPPRPTPKQWATGRSRTPATPSISPGTRQSDLNKPADTTSLSEAVTAAQAVLDQANADRFVLELESGTKLPAGEVVFLPILPSTITSVSRLGGRHRTDRRARHRVEHRHRGSRPGSRAATPGWCRAGCQCPSRSAMPTSRPPA